MFKQCDTQRKRTFRRDGKALAESLRTRTQAPAFYAGPATPGSHVGELSHRRRGRASLRDPVQAENWDGAGRRDALVAAAEASSRAGPAGEEGGSGRAESGPPDGRTCRLGPVPPSSFWLLREVGGRDVISGGRPPPHPDKLGGRGLGCPLRTLTLSRSSGVLRTDTPAPE